MLRGLRVDFYWDGASAPAVSAPFGISSVSVWDALRLFESALFAKP
jgi:hypothetical protein